MQRIQLKIDCYGKYAGSTYDILEVPNEVARQFAQLDMAVILGDEIGETKSPEEVKPKKRKYTRRKKS